MFCDVGTELGAYGSEGVGINVGREGRKAYVYRLGGGLDEIDVSLSRIMCRIPLSDNQAFGCSIEYIFWAVLHFP